MDQTLAMGVIVAAIVAALTWRLVRWKEPNRFVRVDRAAIPTDRTSAFVAIRVGDGGVRLPDGLAWLQPTVDELIVDADRTAVLREEDVRTHEQVPGLWTQPVPRSWVRRMDLAVRVRDLTADPWETAPPEAGEFGRILTTVSLGAGVVRLRSVEPHRAPGNRRLARFRLRKTYRPALDPTRTAPWRIRGTGSVVLGDREHGWPLPESWLAIREGRRGVAYASAVPERIRRTVVDQVEERDRRDGR